MLSACVVPGQSIVVGRLQLFPARVRKYLHSKSSAPEKLSADDMLERRTVCQQSESLRRGHQQSYESAFTPTAKYFIGYAKMQAT